MQWTDFDGWLDAGLGGGAWDLVLEGVRRDLNARAAAFGFAARPGIAGEVIAASGGDAAFLRFCHAHLDCYGAEEVQTGVYPGGVVAWAHAASDPNTLVQDIVVFALWERCDDCAGVAVLAQRLARVAAARRERAALRATLALCGAAFDRLPFGVVVVDEALYVSEPNAACREIFARADGLVRAQGRLSCRFDADRVRLTAAIAHAFAGRVNQDVIAVGRARGAEPYAVFAAQTSAGGPGARRCLLAVVDPEQPLMGALARASLTAEAYPYALARAII